MSFAAPAKAPAYAVAFQVAYAKSASSQMVAASRATSDQYAVWDAFSAMNPHASALTFGALLMIAAPNAARNQSVDFQFGDQSATSNFYEPDFSFSGEFVDRSSPNTDAMRTFFNWPS
jgi:hypothetical protein